MSKQGAWRDSIVERQTLSSIINDDKEWSSGDNWFDLPGILENLPVSLPPKPVDTSGDDETAYEVYLEALSDWESEVLNLLDCDYLWYDCIWPPGNIHRFYGDALGFFYCPRACRVCGRNYSKKHHDKTGH